MLEIRTITALTPGRFDDGVNEALADGWELVRRECFVTGSDRVTTFYAELERIVAEPEEELNGISDFAEWKLTRDPYHPYRCSNCGFKAVNSLAVCPNCSASMGDEE